MENGELKAVYVGGTRYVPRRTPPNSRHCDFCNLYDLCLKHPRQLTSICYSLVGPGAHFVRDDGKE